MILVQKHKGFSLVELMVAIVIGLILVAGVIELFVNNRQVYRVQDAQSRLQETGRYALSILTENIEKTGYLGCATRSDVTLVNTLNNSTEYLWDFNTPIQGNDASDGSWAPALDASITDAVERSDVITLRTIEPPEIRIVTHTASTPPGASDIIVNGGTNLETGDIMLAHDCAAAAIFEITSSNDDANAGTLKHAVGGGTANTPGNETETLGYNFGEGWISGASTNSYYIRNNPAEIPSLYRRTFEDDAQELVEGIEQMQITYGVDASNNGSANEYRTANLVGNWNNVVSVRVSLLAVSLEDNLTVDGPQGYFFNDEQVNDSGDRRLRRVFTRTIALRNRAP